ncbi:MAG: DUF2779 domain-containing protein [Bacteroidales bacterium]|nr:DUF2779 domain-containing protein [Bacteroidales bacterium]
MKKLFTKSAFKQALFCPASLYYYYDSDNYANQMNEDDFLQALAEGGQQVGDLAKVYYDVQADADIKTLNYDESLKKTRELFMRDEVTIAEAAFTWDNCFVRADIIEKKGKQINLIEVKAKSWDENTDRFWGSARYHQENTIKKDIREYVYDVAFQKYVIQNALGPDYTITAYLMMADKTVVSDAPKGVNQFFRVEKIEGGDGKKDRVEIIREAGAKKLRDNTWVLKAFPVDDICKIIIDGDTDEQEKTDKQEGYMGGYKFKEFVDIMSDYYVNHRQVADIKLKGDCFKCPFYSNEKTPGKLDGKKECWKNVADFKDDDFLRPSVGDLWCGDGGGRSFKDELVKKKIYFLDKVSEEDIRPQQNREYPGLSPLQRRLLQIGLATKDEALLADFKDNIHRDVYIDVPALTKLMKPEGPATGWRYPYHMIDFETTAVALPFYEGMHPYEQVAFQFSHHIIKEDGTIEHVGQYLNTEKHHFPNFEFVRQLKEQLEKDEGTIFRYAAHENTILRAIRKQLDEGKIEYAEDKDELIKFIDSITHATREEGGNHRGERDMVDLWEIVKRYYYHPDMKGSNSIKAVLPAILNSSEAIRKKYSEPIYGDRIPSKNYAPDEAIAWIKVGQDGKVENPYKHLDAIASFLGVSPEELERFDSAQEDEEAVIREKGKYIANGGAALAAYTKLQFADEKMTEALKKALYRYCELDTMSMVFIWEYFHEMVGKADTSDDN